MKLSEKTPSQQKVNDYWSRDKQYRRFADNRKTTNPVHSHNIPEACRIAPRNDSCLTANNLMVP